MISFYLTLILGDNKHLGKERLMTNPITSTDFGTIRDALKNGSISLEDVARRFLDFKMAFDNSSDLGALRKRLLEENDRGESPDLDCLPSLKSKVLAACCFETGDATESLKRWLNYRSQSDFVVEPLSTEIRTALGLTARAKRLTFSIDCDGSKSCKITPRATNLLYRVLWPADRNPNIDSADTMNSFWTTYREALRLSGQGSMKTCDIPYLADNTEQHRLEGDCGAQVDMLAYLTHSLGNFIPCFGPFNSGRYRLTKDYWDLTMLGIKEWYEEPSSPLRKVNPLNQGLLDQCRPWLGSYAEEDVTGGEAWRQFVKANFLQPYFEEDSSTVRLFFKEHGFDHQLPANKEELLDCLLSMNAGIVARGNLMLHAITQSGKPERDELLPLVTPVTCEQLLEEVDNDNASR